MAAVSVKRSIGLRKRLSKTFEWLSMLNIDKRACTYMVSFVLMCFYQFLKGNKYKQMNILTPTEICIMEAVYFIGDRTSAH